MSFVLMLVIALIVFITGSALLKITFWAIYVSLEAMKQFFRLLAWCMGEESPPRQAR